MLRNAILLILSLCGAHCYAQGGPGFSIHDTRVGDAMMLYPPAVPGALNQVYVCPPPVGGNRSQCFWAPNPYYAQSIAGSSGLVVNQAQHLRGANAFAFAIADSAPNAVIACNVPGSTVCNYTADASGNLTFTFSPAFTGMIEISAGATLTFSGPLANFPAGCLVGQYAFATDATPGLNLYLCTSIGVWTQQAATNTVGGNQTATSYATNGPNSGVVQIGSKTSGAMSTISQSDTLPAGVALSVNPLDAGGSGSLLSSIDTCATLDPACVSIADEFIPTSNTANGIGALGWDLNNIGASGCGSGANVTGALPQFGLERLTTSATAARGCVLMLDGASGASLGNFFAQPFQSFWVASLSQLTTTPQFRVGFVSGGTAAAKPGGGGVYFCFDVSAGCAADTTHLMACSNVLGTETCTNTGVTFAAATYYRFAISQAGSGKASFAVYSSGAQVGSTVTIGPSGCTATATLPTSITPGMTVANGTTAEADIAIVDSFKMLMTGLAR